MHVVLVLFGLVLVLTGLGETGILPVWEQIVRKMMVVIEMAILGIHLL